MAQPQKRFKAGSCEAAVFENELTRDGQTVLVRKVATQKRYKDKDDEWKSTHSLVRSDILSEYGKIYLRYGCMPSFEIRFHPTSRWNYFSRS